MVVFLDGLPPCVGTGDAFVGKVYEAFGKGFPIVKVADALFIEGAIFYDNGNPRVMQYAKFSARNKDLILGS